MSLIDCLTPQVPPVPSGARVVRGPASVGVFEAETGARQPSAKKPPKWGFAVKADDPDLVAILGYLRSAGAASVPAIVRDTGFPQPKVRYLLKAAKSLGLVIGRPTHLWQATEGA